MFEPSLSAERSLMWVLAGLALFLIFFLDKVSYVA